MTRARFDPAPLQGRSPPAGQVDLAPRRAVRGDERRARAIVNYLDAEDTNSTLNAIRALGAAVEQRADELVIRGVGLRGAEVTGS